MQTQEKSDMAASPITATPQLSEEAVLGELMLLGHANIHDYMHFDGSKISLNLTRLTRAHAAGIVELTATARPERNKQGEVVAELIDVKVKLADKRQALVELGRHLGLFRERPEPPEPPVPPDPTKDRPDFSDPKAQLELAREFLFFIAEAKEQARREAESKSGAANPGDPRPGGKTVAAIAAATVLATGLMLGAATGPAHGRDLGQWEHADPHLRSWYQNLRQPDHPSLSCCGEADAYFADEFEVEGEQTIAIVTDTRDDESLRRPPVAPGTRIVIPKHKLTTDQGNPTGHGVVFYSAASGLVHCYVPPGGV